MPYILCTAFFSVEKWGRNTPHFEDVCRFLNKNEGVSLFIGLRGINGTFLLRGLRTD